ncbi:trypsin-like peptidase domain-containing protein [Planomicrobium sp. Y74]|uniref:S1C family serine protease n=1 Tax=Planomicrobium sp. Y74 TaxID=2478977 RepID=UPI001314F50B|nr:trypsin-like peptidase domain-containing protein [Planomicrobium sp. Y74]
MNRRIDKRNSNTPKKKNWLITLVTILFLAAVGAGVYLMIASPEEQSTTESLEKTSFSEREYQGGGGVNVVIEDEPETIEPGTVNDQTQQPEEDGSAEEATDTEESSDAIQNETVEEVDQPDDSLVVVPEPDLSSMIANAKTYVYTIYTDLDQGSGFLFNNKGDILTNAHVVKDSQYVTVKNSNGQEFNGQVVGFSKTTDIALIRVPEIAGKAAMEMEMSPVSAGTKVFALGSPENIHNTSTEGEITATGMDFFDGYKYEDLYEMTAKIKQGSSGGPLISAESGRILGINSIVLTDNPDIGYSIPMYTVNDQLQEWAANPLPAESDAWQPEVPDATFEEEALRGFISDFYELVPYSLNDDEVTFYQFFLLSGSQGEMAGNEMVEGLKGEQRVFQAVEPVIKKIEIGDNEAYITANATFTFHDKEDDKLVSISHAVVYTIVIDRFGDYQISAITNQDQ